MYKLALSAGHWLGTYKGCPKSLDPNQTDEWTLNSRICNKMQAILNNYDGIEVLRTDDTTGKTNILLADRCDAANKWGADFYLSIHHNGGINGGKGGGIVAYTHPKASRTSKEWQSDLYNAAIAATGLRGNRSNPKPTKNLQEMREAAMPSVLMECGFMDSATDCPIILTEDFADKMAKAFCDVIVKRSGAKKKKPVSVETTTNTYGEAKVTLPVIGRGSKGEAVKTLQRLLNTLGYCDANEKELVVDGDFGAKTLYAFKSFQDDRKLEVDGYCGTASWTELLIS